MATAEGDLQDTASSSTKDKFRMVFLGVTGSGKTSLIDLISNYTRLSRCTIDNIQTFRKKEFEDTSGAMESETNTCVHYEMTINEIPTEIIDTPGLQDSKGKEKNFSNAENIISTLKKVEHINCVCLVTSGRISRFDIVTRSAIEDILGILPKEVQKNTIIIYTNVSSRCDLSFSHKKLKDELGFPLKPFLFDNAYCGWTKLLSNSDSDFDTYSDTALEKQKLQQNLVENFKTLDNLFQFIRPMKSVRTDCFGDLRRVSENIKYKFGELRALERSKGSLSEKILSLSKSITGTREDLGMIQSRLDFVKTNIVHTKEYNTLCNEKDCLNNCHAPCIYTGMITHSVKNCRCIKRDGLCNVCGHHYTSHAHCQYIYCEQEIQLRSDLLQRLEEARTEQEQSTMLLSEQEYQMDELKYYETKAAIKSKIAIFLAEFQRISSKATYEEIIDAQLKKISSVIDFLLPLSKDDLFEHLGLNEYRDGLLQIQEMPFGDEMTAEDKYTWACKVLDIDPAADLTFSTIHGAFKKESKYHDAMKEGDDNIHRRKVHAQNILKHSIETVD